MGEKSSLAYAWYKLTIQLAKIIEREIIELLELSFSWNVPHKSHSQLEEEPDDDCQK